MKPTPKQVDLWIKQATLSHGGVLPPAADLLNEVCTLASEWGSQQSQDAKRYQWLRNRLRVKLMGAVSGSVRDGMEVKVGCAFFDSKVPNTYPPTYPVKQAKELDAAIDAAMKEQP